MFNVQTMQYMFKTFTLRLVFFRFDQYNWTRNLYRRFFRSSNRSSCGGNLWYDLSSPNRFTWVTIVTNSKRIDDEFDIFSAVPTTSLPQNIDFIHDNVTMIINPTYNKKSQFSWHYVRCPPENECNNGHHTCSSKSEKCFDLEEGFECLCGDGYKTET